MKKLLCLLVCLLMLLGGCQKQNENVQEKVFNVGIIQLAQHVALDEATRGFKEALEEKLGDKVIFNYQNASGDAVQCTTIANQFVAEGVDLILANATSALQAASAATDTIPVLGTSITDYATALDLSGFTGVTNTNISGTSDLAPLDGQAQMIRELFPEAKTVGILYCSAEPNSKYQFDTIKPLLEGLGFSVSEFTFSDSNDLANITTKACESVDIIFVPTDNTAASNAETIDSVCSNLNVPVICGEAASCKKMGLATISISYYDIGYQAGLMAYEILVNGKNVGEMPIEYAANVEKMFVKAKADKLNVEVGSDYKELVVE